MGSRPRYTWRYVQTDVALLAPGATQVVNLATGGSLPTLAGLGIFGDYTIRRILGWIAGSSRNVGESVELDKLVYAISIQDDDAVSASVEPNPVTDPSDWMQFGSLPIPLTITGASGSVHPMSVGAIDNKSMRKVNENHATPMFVVEAPSFNTGTVGWFMSLRFLVSHGQR